MVRSGGSLQGPCARIDDMGVLETRRAGARLQWLVLKNAANLRFLGLGALGRCARLLSQERGHILEARRSQGPHDFRMRTSLAARATGNGVARESVSWLRLVHTCEVQRARRVCPRFVSCCRSRSTKADCPKKLLGCPQKHASGERGLAQSGRPRRAKWCRDSDRGGKAARSSPTCQGHSQECRGGWSSIDGRRLGSTEVLLFHEGASKPISADILGRSIRESVDRPRVKR